MMGHVFDLVVRFTRELGGEDAVTRAFAAAGLSPQEYRFERYYPEQDFSALLGAAVGVLGADADTAERAFADFFMRVSPELFPAIFKLSGNARTLLERIPHLHRSIPSAVTVDFHDKLLVVGKGGNWIEYQYDSPHRLCRFLVRTIERVLEHYGEAGRIEEVACARLGAPTCNVRVHFLGPAEQP